VRKNNNIAKINIATAEKRSLPRSWDVTERVVVDADGGSVMLVSDQLMHSSNNTHPLLEGADGGWRRHDERCKHGRTSGCSMCR
jgi:hypothetical protein